MPARPFDAEQKARDALEVAIRNFYGVIRPGDLIVDFVLVTGRITHDDRKVVHTYAPPRQWWWAARGLLDAAIEEDRKGAS